MSDSGEVPRFYGELAQWWPLISAPADYEEEAEYAASLLRRASVPVHTVLELGSGGGNNASHLRRHFELTLVDLSEQMLEVSRQLNPGSEHVQGDMRTVRLGRTFDAVFVHDAVDYMTTEQDLCATIATAHEHCTAGGVVLFAPDHTVESYAPGTDHGGHDAPDGRGARYLEWSRDPDERTGTVRTDYVFVLQELDGSVRVVHEPHTTGLFSRELWLAALEQAGFRTEAVTEETSEDRTPRELFLGHRPPG